VQRYDLVPQDVITWRNVLRQPDQPAVVLPRDQVTPPEILCLVDEADFLDFEEFELGLVDVFLFVMLVFSRITALASSGQPGSTTYTWSVAVGQVVQYRSLVSLRPGVPLGLQDISSVHRDGRAGRRSTEMADDVGLTV